MFAICVAARDMRADQIRRCRNQICVVACLRAVRQQRDVLQPRTDTMSSLQSTSIHCPTGDAVPVVNLLQPDARRHHDVLHRGSVLDSNVRIGVKRLDENTPTSASQTGTHERSRIFNAQQSSLNTNGSG